MIRPVYQTAWAATLILLFVGLAGCQDTGVGNDPDEYFWLTNPDFAGLDLDQVDVEATLALTERTGREDMIVMQSRSWSGEEAYRRIGEIFGALQEHNVREHPEAYREFTDAYNEAMARGDQDAIEAMIEHSRTEQCPSHAVYRVEP